MAMGKIGAGGRGFGKEGSTALGRASGTPWTPLILGSTLVEWWNPQDVAKMTFNLGNVASWTGEKAGIVLSQATAAAQPGYSATARNNKPGLIFDGTKSIQSGASPGIPATAGAFSAAIAAFSNNSGFRVALAWDGASGNAARREIGENGGAPFDAYFFTCGTMTSDGVLWNGVDKFIYGQGDGATTLTSVTDGGTPITTAYTPALADATSVISVGATTAGSAMWLGTIQQVLVMNAVLTTSQRQKLEGWESWYDGKAGSNLPANHPYKSRAPFVSDP
jgi:hypothetical protein